MQDRHTGIPVCFLLLVKDGQILVTRRVNTGYEDGNYQVPTGHVESGETPSAAMVREAKEEIGIDVDAADLRFVRLDYNSGSYKGRDRIDFYFRCERWRGEVANLEPHKCDDVRWVALDALPENTSPHVRVAIESMQLGTAYGES